MWTSHTSLAVPLHALGVDIHHDALAAEPPGRLAHELRILHGGRVDRHLVAAGQQQLADVVERADAAADRERHEHLLGRAADHVEHDVAPFVAGRDVEEHQLVGPFLLVARGHLDRVAGVAEVHEVRPLHDASAVDVETGNHTLGQHGAPALPAAPNRTAKLPQTEPNYAKLLSLGSPQGRVNGRNIV